ncbi:MFS transporter [Mesorhizobium sp. BR1-1-9]|uniref:MFS transporter n=1 Tax=Mesorhizobium sp. BR1-1-9 TaxID=2876646 RepID=UPI001CD153FC|nr:MFS transporter [Mesorhizobium sp. BR1-1-9]MBZ9870422.1 MFS transporter [Mesorhizobium sp. BR1-1-9]
MPKNGSSSLLFVTMFPQAIMSMVVLTPPVVADQVTRAVNLPVEAAGFYTTLNYIFIALGTLCSGVLIPLIGPLRLSFVCIFAGGFALILFGFASLPAIVTAVAFMGLCYGPLTPSSTQAIASQGPIANLTLFMSVRQTSVPIGGVLAGLVVPPLVLWFHLPAAMLMIGVVVTLVGLVAGFALNVVRAEVPPPRPLGRLGLLAPLRYLLQDDDLLRLSFGSMIYGAMQLTVSSLLVVFLMTSLGRNLVVAGLFLGINQAGAIIGRIGWGFLADRLAALRAVLAGVGVGMSVMCMLAGMLWPSAPDWLVGMVVFVLGATTSGWNGVFLTCLIQAVPVDRAGFAASGSLLFSYFGIVLGPPLFGILALFTSFSTAFFAFSVLALAGAFLCRPTRPPATIA